MLRTRGRRRAPSRQDGAWSIASSLSSTPPAVVERRADLEKKRCAVVQVLGLDLNKPARAPEEDDDDAVAKANVPRCG